MKEAKKPSSATRSFLNERDGERWQMTSPALALSSQTRREVLASFLPHYRTASSAEKSLLLDTFVKMTGYARKAAIRVLNHPPACTGPIRRSRLPMYGPEVLQALCVAWKATRYVCAKRLVPFLPTLVGFLERQGYLRLSEESRTRLLSMSVTTAERLLRTQRKPVVRGLSLTTAGPLLKAQIPIRTFEQWDEIRPGFLEADLVARCAGRVEGSYLYTLTLTDIATGWNGMSPLTLPQPRSRAGSPHTSSRALPFSDPGHRRR